MEGEEKIWERALNLSENCSTRKKIDAGLKVSCHPTTLSVNYIVFPQYNVTGVCGDF